MGLVGAAWGAPATESLDVNARRATPPCACAHAIIWHLAVCETSSPRRLRSESGFLVRGALGVRPPRFVPMGNVDAGVMVEGQYLTLGGGRALEARQRHGRGTPAGSQPGSWTGGSVDGTADGTGAPPERAGTNGPHPALAISGLHCRPLDLAGPGSWLPPAQLAQLDVATSLEEAACNVGHPISGTPTFGHPFSTPTQDQRYASRTRFLAQIDRFFSNKLMRLFTMPRKTQYSEKNLQLAVAAVKNGAL